MATYPNLRVARRPLDTIGPAFTMLRAGYRPLLRTLAKYLLLPTLLGSLGIGSFYGGLLGDIGAVEAGTTRPDDVFQPWQVLGLLLGMAAILVVVGVFSLIVAAWVRQIADREEPTVETIWDEARQHFGGVMRLWLLTVAGGMLVMGAVLAVFAGLFSMGTFGLVLLLPALVGMGALFFLATMVLLLAPQAMVSERTGAIASLQRAWELLDGVKGASLVLMFVLWLISSAISYAVLIPVYALVFGAMLMGGGERLMESLAWAGYAMGFVIVVIGLAPYLLYYAAAGVLYYGRVEAHEYVGFQQEMAPLLDAFPEAPPADAFAAGPPPLPGAEAPAPPLPPVEPTAQPSVSDDPHARWRARPSDPPADAP